MRRRKAVWDREPTQAVDQDIDELNGLFTEAFTARYRSDGLASVRVPPLNPDVWRFALRVAGDGALLWRHRNGTLLGFNMVHCSGGEGWMGPLAVRPAWQGCGLGSHMVQTGIAYLDRHRVATIGLETMPRTVENIGFYSRLGFQPGYLTITLARDLAPPGNSPASPSNADQERSEEIAACQALLAQVGARADFAVEMVLTHELDLGGLTTIRNSVGEVTGFALWHTAPLTRGRARDDVRVLKAAALDMRAWQELREATECAAAAAGGRRLLIRCQTAFAATYRDLVGAGYEVHWTDVRMCVRQQEGLVPDAVVLSNWEI